MKPKLQTQQSRRPWLALLAAACLLLATGIALAWLLLNKPG